MSEFWQFAAAHPITAFFLVTVVCYAVTRPFRYAAIVYKRRLRSHDISLHGWPTAPVDADGDVVYPSID